MRIEARASRDGRLQNVARGAKGLARGCNLRFAERPDTFDLRVAGGENSGRSALERPLRPSERRKRSRALQERLACGQMRARGRALAGERGAPCRFERVTKSFKHRTTSITRNAANV